jgi:type IV pilus assembly protein PilW
MQVLYGEDTDGNLSANKYVHKATVGNVDNVVAVRIAVMFVSEDFAASAADLRQYPMLDATYTATGDRRMRRVFTTTVTLRNQAQ